MLRSMDIRHRVVVFDAADMESESAFWAALVGGTVHKDDVWHMIFVDAAPVLAVQHAPDHKRPTWPDGERQQQVHYDLWVDDYAVAHGEVMSLGATILQPTASEGRERWAVYADPAGHPFCLCCTEE
jgi:predicted enzyme related to lactoylglutathione lyase